MWRKDLKAVTKNGGLGDPRKAEASKGEEYLELWAGARARCFCMCSNVGARLSQANLILQACRSDNLSCSRDKKKEEKGISSPPFHLWQTGVLGMMT